MKLCVSLAFVASANDGLLTLSFSQTFTSVSEEGNDLLNQYKKEDFAEEQWGHL